MTYTEFIRDQLKGYGTGQPIYTASLAVKLAEQYGLPKKEAAAATSVAFKRIMDDAAVPELRFYQKGIYYLTAPTPFGETGIDTERLIADKYLLPDIGYETGYAMLYRMGLTTQLPRERCLATNKAADCVRLDNRLGVLIRPPKTKVNGRNKLDLQFLDVLNLMEKAPVDASQPYALLAEYIQRTGLEYGRLLSLAHRYYNQKTIMQLARVAGEGCL